MDEAACMLTKLLLGLGELVPNGSTGGSGAGTAGSGGGYASANSGVAFGWRVDDSIASRERRRANPARPRVPLAPRLGVSAYMLAPGAPAHVRDAFAQA